MKEWHREHAEKVIVRFATGLSADASDFEKRNYRKYGTVTGCVRQIEYDIHHGVQKGEIIEIIRKIRRNKKYASIRSDRKAMIRLQELGDQLSGISKEQERLAWHQYSYR